MLAGLHGDGLASGAGLHEAVVFERVLHGGI